MFEASSVYFQCVNERAAHVEIDRVFSYSVDLGHSKSPISLRGSHRKSTRLNI